MGFTYSYSFRNDGEDTIVYGRVYEVDVIAKVENLGEAAYQSEMKLNFTSDLDIDSITINGVCYWCFIEVASFDKILL